MARTVSGVGQPGGSRIIGYVAGRSSRILDWGYGRQQAAALPHCDSTVSVPYDLERRH